jgi:hypothetical protein
MLRGNWRQVFLSGPYAVKVPRPEPDRAPGARCLSRWELEMWTIWRPRFGWPHLCPVVWGDPEGHVLVMERAMQDVVLEEIVAFEEAWMASQRLELPGEEAKPEDWGHLPGGKLVVCDYGYACDSDEAIERQRRDYAEQLRLRGS